MAWRREHDSLFYTLFPLGVWKYVRPFLKYHSDWEVLLALSVLANSALASSAHEKHWMKG